MTIAVDRTKKEFTRNDSAIASEDLSNMQFCAVAAGGGATGNMTVGKPSGQGGLVYGILQNAPASGEIAEIARTGMTEWRAHSTFNAGSELTVHDNVLGRCEAAASGDYVCAIAREASQSANHAVSVDLIPGYYKP